MSTRDEILALIESTEAHVSDETIISVLRELDTLDNGAVIEVIRTAASLLAGRMTGTRPTYEVFTAALTDIGNALARSFRCHDRPSV